MRSWRHPLGGGDSDRPGVVRADPEIQAVLDRAGWFAQADRVDAEAVDAVRASAHDDSEVLTRALRTSRFQGWHREYRYQNHVFRLIEAAAERGPVRPVDAEDAKRIDVVTEFLALPLDEQWERLAELEPRLRRVEIDARNGKFGHLSSHGDKGSFIPTGEQHVGPDGKSHEMRQPADRSGPPSSREIWQAVAAGRGLLRLRARVSPLVGPDRAEDAEVLLRTMAAQRVAISHLAGVTPG